MLVFSVIILCFFIFFFNDTATTEIYTYLHTLSLHDALPIFCDNVARSSGALCAADTMNAATAFVVGGSGGLGSAICRSLAAEWNSIVIGYRSNRKAAETLAEEIGPGRATALRCDLRDAENITSSLSSEEHTSELQSLM